MGETKGRGNNNVTHLSSPISWGRWIRSEPSSILTDVQKSIVMTATIFTVFKAVTKETTKGTDAAAGLAASFVVVAGNRHLCIGFEHGKYE